MNPTVKETIPPVRVYCVLLKNAAGPTEAIRIRADCMEREQRTTLRTFTRDGQNVGEITDPISAWWIEEDAPGEAG